MNFKNFDLNLLVALHTLLSECNVTRAADRLCVSQPAMSNALQRIREHFGDPILVRSGREMRPTALAESLIEPVRELMIKTEQILKGDSQFDPMTARRSLRIGMSDYCISVFAGVLMRFLSAEAPGINVEILPLTLASIDDLIAGNVDMCMTAQDLRMLVPDVDTALFGKGKMFTDRFVCAVSADNQDVGETLDMATYLKLPHAVMRFAQNALSLEEQAIRRLGLEIDIAVTSWTFASLPLLLPGTPLIITLQERLCAKLAEIVPMRLFPPPVPIIDLEETLFWHNRSEHDMAHRWLRELIFRAAGTMMYQ